MKIVTDEDVRDYKGRAEKILRIADIITAYSTLAEDRANLTNMIGHLMILDELDKTRAVLYR